jgi:two-component system chemotaxis response regulator CheY
MSKIIMTVDDSASVRQMVSLTLKDAGYAVIEACDGKDALAKLSGPVGMIVTDLNMPNMNGIELIRAVRATPQYKFTPVTRKLLR